MGEIAIAYSFLAWSSKRTPDRKADEGAKQREYSDETNTAKIKRIL